MNTKHVKGWLKHGDFILLDLLSVQLSFFLAYWIFQGRGNPYENEAFRYQGIILLVCQLLVTIFTNSYGGILRRKPLEELVAVVRYITEVVALALIYLFMAHTSLVASRLQVGFTAVFFVVIDFALRSVNKLRIFRSGSRRRSIVLVTAGELVDEAMGKLSGKGIYQDFFISSIVVMDPESGAKFSDYGVPVRPLGEDTVSEIGHDWVDEVFLLQPDSMPFPTELMDALQTMGITVNYSMTALAGDRWPQTDIRKLGEYKVLTGGIRFAGALQLAVKRLIDILGGLVGCLFTGLLTLFVGPAIYFADPGPIFFTQERIGQNGKKFKMHKFRSMYMDAEARKAELMDRNKMESGLMFKMDDDPRIIGSEKKDKNGKPKGIGNFIRNYSIDEFPQFYDCLIGNLSLVGWRPCTLQEWEVYDVHHRIRASMKPGITGMWQVSGRSKITDFDEVVRLDKEYLEHWSLWLDLKILFKTVWVVIARKGAE